MFFLKRVKYRLSFWFGIYKLTKIQRAGTAWAGLFGTFLIVAHLCAIDSQKREERKQRGGGREMGEARRKRG